MRVEVPTNLTVPEIMALYKIPKTTAWRASQRGWFMQDYHVRRVVLGGEIDSVTLEKCYAYARKMLRYMQYAPIDIEDAVQDAMLRVVELAGVLEPTNLPAFAGKCARRFVLNYSKKNIKNG